MTITNLSQISEHIEREMREALRIPTLDAVRAIANEAGIRRARIALAEAPDRLAAAQAAFREAQAAEALAREGYQQALLETEWELDGRFKTDGNKTYLRLTCEACEGEGKVAENFGIHSEGEPRIVPCATCDGLGTSRKQMTADERKAWSSWPSSMSVPGCVGARRRPQLPAMPSLSPTSA
jgi:hypothetical protein